MTIRIALMLVLTCLLVSSLVVSRTQAQGSGEATIFAERCDLYG